MSEPSKTVNPQSGRGLTSDGILPLGAGRKASAWDSPIFGQGVDLDRLAIELSTELGVLPDAPPVAQAATLPPSAQSPVLLANPLPIEPVGWPVLNETVVPVVPPLIQKPTKVAPVVREQVPHKKPTAAPVTAQKQNRSVAPVQPKFIAPSTSEVWGMKLSQVTMDQTLEAIGQMVAERVPRYIITANLNYAMLLAGHTRLAQTTAGAAMVLADGQPLVWRSRWAEDGPVPERVTGSELIYRMAEQAAVRGWRIYFLGAEPGVAQKCADALGKRYPGLQVAGVHSPPYRKLTDIEMQEQRDRIKAAKPDILLVAFGQPKGELWIEENYQQLGVPVSIQIGASFDFVAGRAKRAPKLFQVLALEWAYRMMCDPMRLVPRYASNAWFLTCILLQEWKRFVDKRFGLHPNSPTGVNPSHSG